MIIRVVKHFSVNLGSLGSSDRLLLPQADGCQVKVTRFNGTAGSVAMDVRYDVDETIYVVSGIIVVWKEGGKRNTVSAGGCLHVRAGEIYNLSVCEDCVAICVFSPVGDILPDDK